MTVPEPQFRVSTVREGYATPDVDAAVGRVLAALDGKGPWPTRADLEALTFRPVRLQQGYEMSDVDGWFDLVADELDRRTGTAPTGRPASGSVWPSSPSATAPPGPPTDLDLRVFDGRMAAIVLPLLALAVVASWLLVR